MSVRHASFASRALPRLLPAALAALLAGCMTEQTEDPPGTHALVGQPLSALKGAKSAAAADGKLYVANRDSSAQGIAVVDLASGKVTAFHTSVLPPNEVALSGDSVLAVAETDYKSAALSRLGLKSGTWESGYKAVSSDHGLRASGDTLFLMERGLGVVTGFTGGSLTKANVVLNANTGAGTNPYQVAVHGKTAFVTRYGSAHLLVLEADKMDGGTRDSIDLSAYVADSLKGKPGSVPHMDAAVAHGGRLFVTVQRLTGWQAKDTSKVLVIDASTRKVTGEIPLRRKNPTSVAVRGKWMYVSCVEGFGSFTGAVERIDMEKAEHAGIVIEEKDLVPPSDITEFVPVSDSKGFAIGTPDFKTGHLTEVTIP
jgi:DNA-binding beta-propeller fold protein YncE